MAIARIERVALRTADLGRARVFYEHHLGAVAAPAAAGTAGTLSVEFCGVRLELIERDTDHAGAVPRRPAHARLGFALGSADGVDELTARLSSAGYQVLEWPRRGVDGAYESLVLDPDGNPVALTV
jgi:lactoylglutathione lyase